MATTTPKIKYRVAPEPKPQTELVVDTFLRQVGDRVDFCAQSGTDVIVLASLNPNGTLSKAYCNSYFQQVGGRLGLKFTSDGYVRQELC